MERWPFSSYGVVAVVVAIILSRPSVLRAPEEMQSVLP